MVTGRPDLISAELREQGYRDAHAAAGVAVDEALLRSARSTPSRRATPPATLLALPEPPTAIFAANDLSALATLEVAAELGIDVPGQLSVVGFDNIPESALAHPPLTTVQQPMRQMGHDAIAMLVALIAGEELADTHLTLDTTLVVRRSTAAPGGDHDDASSGATRRRRSRTGSPTSSPRMTLEEKVASSPASGGSTRTPAGWRRCCARRMGPLPPWDDVIADGLGQLTRTFGTAPLEPVEGMRILAERQRDVVAANRFGIPAQVHEECLTGLAAWRATIYPSPLCWAATFDPALVERMGARIGGVDAQPRRPPGPRAGARRRPRPALGPGRGDPRRGPVPRRADRQRRTCAASRASGVVATLKHFVGYSASRAARNLAPVSMGPRELADVILPPFEMALRAGARSVMNSYTDIDGVPVAADPALLTTLLRDDLGFTGHGRGRLLLGRVPAHAPPRRGRPGRGGAARARGRHRRRAAVGQRLRRAAARRARRRDRRREAGRPRAVPGAAAEVRARPARPGLGAGRAGGRRPRRRRVAGARPRAGAPVGRAAGERRHPAAAGGCAGSPSSGPRADTSEAMLGCYSFPMHVLVHHPGVETGLEIRTVREALADTYDVTYALGCPVAGRRATPTSRPRSRPPPAPRSASPCSATRPACSATAPPARAATSPTWTCPVARRSCSRRCSTPVRRWSRCSSSGARTT